MDIFEANRELDDNGFLKYLHEEIEMKGKHEELLRIDEESGRTILEFVITYGRSVEVMSKLIELGGEEFVMAKDLYGRTALHTACSWDTPIEVILRLIDIGGRDLVMSKMDFGMTAFTVLLCSLRQPPNEVVSKFIEVGGRELLLSQDDLGTVLHHAISSRHSPIETIFKLIETGGRELVMQKNEYDCTALHFGCLLNVPKEIIFKLIETGGRNLVTVQNHNGLGAIHYYIHDGRKFDETLTILIREGILGKFGGCEFGGGGLFTEYDDVVQRRIYDCWEDLSIFLEIAFLTLEKEERPPLLHAAIIADAPLFVLSSIIKRFRVFGCILKRDSVDCLPIDVAVISDLQWDKGMREITEATATALKQPLLYVAAAK